MSDKPIDWPGEQQWQEMVIAGKVFAIIGASQGLFQAECLKLDLESASIDHGKIRLEMRDGRKFGIDIRLMSE